MLELGARRNRSLDEGCFVLSNNSKNFKVLRYFSIFSLTKLTVITSAVVQLLQERKQIATSKETHLILRRFIPAVLLATGTTANPAKHNNSSFQR